MSSAYILAIDVGTTNCKTVVVDERLSTVARRVVEYTVSAPQPGWAEQHPDVWWNAVRESVRDVVAAVGADNIQAIGLSGQMHGLVLLDRNGAVLRPAILWNDQRCFVECDDVYGAVGGKAGLLRHTNNPMLPGYTGGKILWVRRHEPAIYAQIAAVLLPKDYIRYRLTGLLGTDVSDASGTGLFDVRRRQWATDLLDALDISARWLPPVHESADVVGGVTEAVAADTGLKAGTPVVAGGGDAVMQTVGAGAVDDHVALIVIGTGGNVTVSVPTCVDNPDAKLQVFCHVIPGRWTAMGVTLSAGSSLKWYRDTLGGMETAVAREMGASPYDLLSAEAARSPVGAHGLLFLPYLQGERCPHTDVSARGTFVGLGLSTTRGDIVRSVMEGVTLSLKDVLALLLDLGVEPERIHSSGGGSASAVWRQMQADVFGRPVTTLDHSEDASAIGAAIVAGVSQGCWASVEAAATLIAARTVDEPIPANAARYAALFEIYRALYPALQASYVNLRDFATGVNQA